jgi:hypothetical protein
MLVASITPRDSHGLSRGIPDGESRPRESRTYGGWVHVFRSGGRSRLDASRVFRTGSPQGLVEREGASREEARSTADAGHGWREGETVRGRAFVPNSSRSIGLRVKARLFATRRKAFSGCCASGPHGSGVPGSFGLQVKVRLVLSARKRGRRRRRPAHRTVSETGSGVPAGDHESVRDRRHSVKAPRGPRRSEGSSHPRR